MGNTSKFKIYLKSILVPVLIGLLVGILITNYIDYNSLNKPIFSPPSLIFPIIWSILYILMGVSFGILKSKSLVNEKLSSIYYFQLFINALWPIFFFVFKWRLFSFIWIILLDILVFKMILEFYDKNKISGLLQIPYFIWVLFASYLNLFVYLLN